MITLIAAMCMAVLMGCSSVHPSDKEPDVMIRVNGCLYMGFRTGHCSDLVHAGNCDNPIHLRMHPDTVYLNATTTNK